jgi:FdhD protein
LKKSTSSGSEAAGRAAVDRVAVEEPLEVRVHGHPFAVIMRTPGADRELAAGFLFAERTAIGGRYRDDRPLP